jgi:hypothetical protein
MNLLTVGSVRGVPWVVAVASVLLVACGSGNSIKSPPSCPTGAETCPCYGNGTCNTGLVCLSELCVNPATGNGGAGGTLGTGGASGSGGTIPGTGGTTPGSGGTTPGTGGTTPGTGGSTGTGGSILPVNLIKNGDFSKMGEYWNLTLNSGSGAYDFTGGAYCIYNTASSTDLIYLLSFSLGYPPTPSDAFVVTPGVTYTMAYMASATATTAVQVKVGHVEAPYTELWSATNYVAASSTLQLYSNTITSSAGDTAGGLVFNVTLAYGASICFDNVVLVQQ